MADLNWLHNPLIVFADGATPTASQFSENWYHPVAANPDSLDVINGFIDSDNLAAGTQLSSPHIQRGEFLRAEGTGATANMDFFHDLFEGLEMIFYPSGLAATWAAPTLGFNGTPYGPLPEEFLAPHYIPIPGAGITFYAPTRGALLLTWNITWLNDGKRPQNGFYEGWARTASRVQLWVQEAGAPGSNGKWVQDKVNTRDCAPGYVPRSCGMGKPLTVGAARRYLEMSRPDVWGRHWNGHKIVNVPEAGWYSAGLRITAPGRNHDGLGDIESACAQTRVKCRSMRYIFMSSSVPDITTEITYDPPWPLQPPPGQ